MDLGFATRVLYNALFDDILLSVPSILALTVTMLRIQAFRLGKRLDFYLEEQVEALVQQLKRQRVCHANKGKTRVRYIMEHLWNFLLWDDHGDEDYALEMVKNML
eukprot:COSAG06_NODE_17764_length_922_cov_2.189550_2_plen_105_part_00